MSSNKAIRRLQADFREYYKSPIEGTAIYYDENLMTRVYVAIAGPKDSVYENGIYFFVFDFPDSYPNEPPSGKFLNWQNTADRIHPNMYKCGKLCFSFLGTWPGPSWTSVMGLSSIILMLQTVLDENPLKNEPGYDKGYVTDDHISYQRIIQFLNMRDFIIKSIKFSNSNHNIHNHQYLLHFKPFLQDYFKKNYIRINEQFQKLLEKTPTPVRLSITYQGTSTTIDYNSLLDDIKLMCEKYKTGE